MDSPSHHGNAAPSLRVSSGGEQTLLVLKQPKLVSPRHTGDRTVPRWCPQFPAKLHLGVELGRCRCKKEGEQPGRRQPAAALRPE